MPSTPSGSKGGDHRKGAVVLTPNGKSSAGNASPKGGGRDFTKLTSNVKSRSTQKEESENGYPGRNASREGWGEKKDSGWSRGKGKSFAKGQSKGKTKSASKASETASVGEANAAAPQLPRVRDEIQEEVDGIVSINSNLSRTDFDGRVFQYLHAIHGVGGQEKVRKALQTIHLSTLHKQRNAVKKWPAYLATLLKKFFDDLGAQKKEESFRAQTEAEAYEKQLSSSVDALFDQSVDKNVVGNPVANPQEAAAAAGDLRSTPQEWFQKAVTEEREQQWLRRGSNLILSALLESPIANTSIPPGFTPPQVPSPASSPLHGSLLGNSVSSPGAGMASPLAGSMFASTPPSQVLRPPPPFTPPPPPPPHLSLQPPPPPPTFLVRDPYNQQQMASSAAPVHTQQPTHQSIHQPQGGPRVITAPSNKNHPKCHEPRVVPPPRRQQQSEGNALNAAGAVRPPPPPTRPPMDASGAQLLPEASWTMKSTSLRPPPWPAQYVSDASMAI